MDNSAISFVELELLAQSSLFTEVPRERLTKVLQTCHRRNLPARKMVFQRGDMGSEMCAILSGGVKVSTLSSEGKEIIFDVMCAGDFFGELSLLDGKPRTGTVTTLVNSVFLIVGKEYFLDFLMHHPQTAVSLLKTLTSRLRQMDAFLEDVLFLDAEARLAKRLMALAGIYGHEMGSAIQIDLKMSQQDLANLVGITRESVNKHFKGWEKAGVVAMEQGRIVVNRPQLLRSLATDNS